MRPPRLNFFGVEGERDAAVLPSVFDPTGAAAGDGGELGKLRRRWSDSGREEIALIQEMQEERGERREREQVGVFDVALDHQGGSGRAAWASPTRRHGASDDGHGGGERERKNLRKAPDKF